VQKADKIGEMIKQGTVKSLRVDVTHEEDGAPHTGLPQTLNPKP